MDNKTGVHNIYARQKPRKTSCQKMANFARVCRSKQNKSNQRRINYVEDVSSEEEESEPEEIRQITQINKLLPDNNDHYGVEMRINGKT